jgi:hypothetical protein
MAPGVARPLFLIGGVRSPARLARQHQMIALLAPDRAAVDHCHEAALAG